jgi:hypothetical protein
MKKLGVELEKAPDYRRFGDGGRAGTNTIALLNTPTNPLTHEKRKRPRQESWPKIVERR